LWPTAIIVVTSLGWLTTQAVVEKAREEGAKELVALRASICSVKFKQRPDAEAKLAEFKALSWSQRDTPGVHFGSSPTGSRDQSLAPS
jgi:hypothetical protein